MAWNTVYSQVLSRMEGRPIPPIEIAGLNGSELLFLATSVPPKTQEFLAFRLSLEVQLTDNPVNATNYSEFYYQKIPLSKAILIKVPIRLDTFKARLDIPEYIREISIDVWARTTNDATSNNSYSMVFGEQNLSIAGVLPVEHFLGKHPSFVSLWLGGGEIIQPDEIYYVDQNRLSINLSSYQPIPDESLIIVGD